MTFSMKKLTILACTVLAYLMSFSIAKAEGAAGYTIEGVPNSHQVDSNVGYFYLKEGVGETDQIKVNISNSSADEQTFIVKAVDANTNVNGIIEYGDRLSNHSSNKHPLTSIVTADQEEVTVAGNSTAEVSLTVRMPQEAYDGVILGGVRVEQKQKKDKGDEGISIKNTYSYTIAIALTTNDIESIRQKVDLTLDGVKAMLFDSKKVVQASILNENPYATEKLTVTGSIYKKGSNTALLEQKKDNVEIAPYSTYPFQFDFGRNTLKAGKYRFVGKAKSGVKEWTFEQEFEITEKQAQKINEESVYQVRIPQWLTLLEWTLAVLSFVVTVVLLIIRKKGVMTSES